MARAGEKLDPRILRTKQALRAALLELIREQGFKDITVKLITERAGLNRTTFYLHYKNKEDFLTSEFTQLWSLVAGTFPHPVCNPSGGTRDPDRKLILTNFRNLEELAPLHQAILGRNGPRSFNHKLVDDLRGRSHGAQYQPERQQDLPYQTPIQIYLVAGHLGLLEWWLKEDCPVPPDRMADLVMTLYKTTPGVILEKITALGRNQQA